MSLTIEKIELLATKGHVIVLGLVDGTWCELVRNRGWVGTQPPGNPYEFSQRRDLNVPGDEVRGAEVRCSQRAMIASHLTRCLLRERHLGLCNFPEVD